MKDKTSNQTNLAKDETAKYPKVSKEKTASKQKLEAESNLRARAAKRTNYHNDGPGGGYQGL